MSTKTRKQVAREAADTMAMSGTGMGLSNREAMAVVGELRDLWSVLHHARQHAVDHRLARGGLREALERYRGGVWFPNVRECPVCGKLPELRADGVLVHYHLEDQGATTRGFVADTPEEWAELCREMEDDHE